MTELYDNISQLQTAHPEALYIVAGDFNKACLKSGLPKLYQHVDCATRGDSTLDLVYTNIKAAYRAASLPHIGSSDHLTVTLQPAYRAKVQREPAEKKSTTVWPQDALPALQDCFDCTQWSIFREAATSGDFIDLQEYTEAVVGFISKCVDDVTEVKMVKTRAIRKPWLTGEVCSLLKTRDFAFKAGDAAAYREARNNLKKGIREAKRQYGRNLEKNFEDTRDIRCLWQGFQTVTGYKHTAKTAQCNNPSLPDDLNRFYSRFEDTNIRRAQRLTPASTEQVLQVSAECVRRTFSRINPRKASGPDNVPGRVLKSCADELKDVFTDIFNISLSQAVVPTCFKSATIVAQFPNIQTSTV
ncbi:hypothetical protein N1851_023265 [Merluccius polli]|uniref:Endonuclease/exonuclease/phosphatase domain-containing protein n=1 Tax=Merluccius polli TaxID=89951 RepID=A0AA47MGD8_MERPO|nr:hypothetical protein N1851_023265 [Merluccius polli]